MPCLQSNHILLFALHESGIGRPTSYLVHLKVKQNNFSQPETIIDCAGKQSLQMSSDSYWTFWPGCVFTEQIYFCFPRHFYMLLFFLLVIAPQ
jgi:hypothetical protein